MADRRSSKIPKKQTENKITNWFKPNQKKPGETRSVVTPAPPEHPNRSNNNNASGGATAIHHVEQTISSDEETATEESTNAKASSQHMEPSGDTPPIDVMTGNPRRRNLPDSPYHPEDTSCIPPKVAKHQQFHFQAKWFSMYSWLHYDHEKEGVLCFSCHDAYQKGLLDIARVKDLAFITTGFKNWKKVMGRGKKALGRFEQHQLSSTHNFALSQLKAQEAKTVRALIDSHSAKQQEIHRRNLVRVFTSVRYLVRQGIASRGHDEEEGNFCQLLKLRSEDDPHLGPYLSRDTNFTSHQAQEEIMQMLSHSIIRDIVKDIRGHVVFAVMVDGTQDINGTEQESICFRSVDDELNVREDFIGLYEMASSTGEAISIMILDVIARLGLSVENLRAQTYDGASNMSGKYRGCQAKIKEKQPLAMYFHCSSHVSNLVMKDAVTECTLVRDALQWVHELGVLYRRSGKYKGIFKDIAADIEGLGGTSSANIRPLCPTRWLCRQAAVDAVIQNYEAILASLEEMSHGISDTSAKANGLLDRFQKAEVLLALKVANKPLASLETLNRGLQSKSANISGMLESVAKTTAQLEELRNAEAFHEIFRETSLAADKYDLDPLQIPRRRQPPKRITGPAAGYKPTTAEEYYRIQYYKLLDGMLGNLKERFDISSNAGLSDYNDLQKILTTGKVDEVIVKKYPELSDLNPTAFKTQLDMFLQTTNATSMHEASLAFRGMSTEVRALFPHVLMLLRLLLVCPVTSCECERSFSALRRLKTWLRSTMTQRRLNHVAVCNVHKRKLDTVDIIQLVREFAGRSQTRKNMFGNFT
ncbi:zinc finger MYM-type protein 1-like [Apostichopus japonicus]|uniref:zinc finger MYM-type protein 1-like n=1 Tax=Stichopus japonicus TaxID=307972 RepID=UPI003AB49FA1